MSKTKSLPPQENASFCFDVFLALLDSHKVPQIIQVDHHAIFIGWDFWVFVLRNVWTWIKLYGCCPYTENTQSQHLVQLKILISHPSPGFIPRIQAHFTDRCLSLVWKYMFQVRSAHVLWLAEKTALAPMGHYRAGVVCLLKDWEYRQIKTAYHQSRVCLYQMENLLLWGLPSWRMWSRNGLKKQGYLEKWANRYDLQSTHTTSVSRYNDTQELRIILEWPNHPIILEQLYYWIDNRCQPWKKLAYISYRPCHFSKQNLTTQLHKIANWWISEFEENYSFLYCIVHIYFSMDISIYN